jgi:hypothetical protein
METIMPHTPIKEYELKQHSPIIHFQYNQHNATLRATDLKPRLDASIGNTDHKKRYQIRLIAKGTYPQDTHPLYFGNMSKDKTQINKKQCVRVRGKLLLQINTFFNRSLQREIEGKLPECLALNNFGARQSKGFGSFYFAKGFDPNEFNPIEHIENVFAGTDHPVYYFDVPKQSDSSQENLDNVTFDYIQALYKAMKPGVNEEYNPQIKNKYLKSLLWQYCFEKYGQLNWEKRMMKRMLIKKPISQKEPNLYIRGLLGLASTFWFKRTRNDARMDKDYSDHNIFNLNRDETFNVSNDQIARFESPITFKPVNNRVYIILRQDKYKHDNIDIQGQTFTFSNSGGKIDLKVPDSFVLDDFMNFVCNKVNKNDFGTFHGSTATILKGMRISKL